MAISNFSKYAAEALGTFVLVFTVGLVSTAGQLDSSLAVFGPTAVGFVLCVMVYAVGPVSGAHLNPAVTFAAWLQKEIDYQTGLMYIIAQCSAGASAGLLASFLYGFRGGDAFGPTNARFALGAPLVEFLYTFMLCYVVLNCCMSSKAKANPNTYYGVAIGFVIIAGGYGGGSISGGAFNPAVALGMNFLHPSVRSLYLPIYAACEMAGAFAAVIAFRIVRQEDEKEDDNAWGPTKFARKVEGLFDAEDTCEFVGAFFFTMSVSMNALAGKLATEAGGEPNAGGVWSIAASLMVLIYATGDVSGGVFNPAVTIALLGRWYGTGKGFGEGKLMDFKTHPKEGPKYFIAQCVGAAAGAGITMVVFLASGIFPAAQIAPAPGHGILQAFFAELAGTFLLCYVILCVATTKAPLQSYAPFAIGGAVVAGGYAFGPISGGVLNPAVTMANSFCFKLSFIYTTGPVTYFVAQLLGGVIAAVIFKFLTHPHEYDDADTSKAEPLLAGA